MSPSSFYTCKAVRAKFTNLVKATSDSTEAVG